MLSPEIEKALNASEFLALDNVILARRAAEAERQLERERCGHTGGTSIMGALLLGWTSAKEQQELDAAAELRARADENVQLQHALFEQQHEAQRSQHAQAVRGGACVSLLRRALAETEAELEVERTAMIAAATEHARGRNEARQSLEALHSVCRELRERCASALDELEASGATIASMRVRESEHAKWAKQVKEAWAREQRDRQAEQEKQKHMEMLIDRQRSEAADALVGEAAAARDADEAGGARADGDGRAAAEPEREPDWLADAARAVSLSALVDGSGHESGEEGGGEEDGGEAPLRAMLQTERAARGVAEARLGLAERRAAAAEEELALSSERFQQQIATLSDALAELHAKEDARRRRQLELREQKQRQQQQQPRQEQAQPEPSGHHAPAGDSGGGGSQLPPVIDAEAFVAAEREAAGMMGKASSAIYSAVGGLGAVGEGLSSRLGDRVGAVGEGLSSIRARART